MKRQNDWFTGIDYYHNYREKEIVIERKTIVEQTQQYMHEQVEMLFVLSGNACVSINGIDYSANEGSFFCMYSHHFYNIHSITEKLDVVFVKFYIGLFMYMSWEKHPKYANSRLMYDTCPKVQLTGENNDNIRALVFDLIKENIEKRFASMNMIEYKTLLLHGYFCRFAYENIGINKKYENEIWSIIKRVILTTSTNLVLDEVAKETSYAPSTLNKKIKETCGYTFFQLQQYGKIINACALLHFPELSMEYISDLLGFSSVNSFYKSFVQFCKITPREYQKTCIGSDEIDYAGKSLGMQFLQYLHINFMQDLTIEDLCEEFYIKPYTVNKIFENIFGASFKGVLNEIRVNYAASFLRTTNLKVVDISYLCGFDSISTFQRSFSTYINQTPLEYRKSMQ